MEFLICNFHQEQLLLFKSIVLDEKSQKKFFRSKSELFHFEI